MPSQKTPTAKAFECNYLRALRGLKIDRRSKGQCFDCETVGVLCVDLFFRWTHRELPWRPRNLLCQSCFGAYVDEEIQEAVEESARTGYYLMPKHKPPRYNVSELPDEPPF